MGGFCGYGGSVWVMGEWGVGYWIVGVTSFQKIYGLCGLKHHIVEIRDHVTGAGQTNKQTNNEQWKIGLLSQWKLEAEFRKKITYFLYQIYKRKKIPWAPRLHLHPRLWEFEHRPKVPELVGLVP